MISPDETIEVSISVAGPLTYRVRVDGQPVVSAVEARPEAPRRHNTWPEGGAGQRHPSEPRLAHGRIRSASAASCAIITTNCTCCCANNRRRGGRLKWCVRAFNDGVAFRYELLSQPGMREFVLEQELTEFAFPGDFICYSRRAGKGIHGSAGVGVRSPPAERHQAGLDHWLARVGRDARRVGGDRGGRLARLGRHVARRR